MKDNKGLATTILERVQEKAQSATGQKDPTPNPAALALMEALKDDDPNKLAQSLSDFIRIHSAKK